MRAYCAPVLALFLLNIGASFAIAQGIRVRSAYYGPSNGVGIDVRRQVQHFADYGEPFRVGSDSLGIDNNSDQPCVLVVIYELNGRQISERVREGEVFYFRNARGADAGLPDRGPPVRVLRALYGTKGRYVDVTRIVRSLLDGTGPFQVSNETFGIDPYRGERKWLRIAYVLEGVRRDAQYAEGDLVELPSARSQEPEIRSQELQIETAAFRSVDGDQSACMR